MSFAERNKRWLLPLLGVAAAGAAWLNCPPSAAPPQAPASAAPPSMPAGAEHDPCADENDTLPLLLAGRAPLSGELRKGHAPPVLHPDQWEGLVQPPAVKVPPRPPGKVPALDFLLETPTRREAWIGGRGYREGEDLPGGYVLRRITASGVVLAGPAGEVGVPLQSGPGGAAPRKPSPKKTGSGS